MGKQAKKVHSEVKKTTPWLQQAKKIATNEKVVIIAFLLIALFLGTYFRLYTVNLPATHDWAQDSYYNQVRQQIDAQVRAQYPNLPAAQRQEFVNEQFEAQLATQGDALQGQIDQTAAYFKSQLQDEFGNTYLLAIDPYLAYSYAKNYVENGHPGTTITDGKPNMEYRNGREPRYDMFRSHAWAMVQFHKATNWITGWNLQQSIFYFPVFIIGLAIICAFFVARRIAGNFAGLIAGSALGLNSALLGRTPAGFSDTDAYIIFFPLLVIWFFAESIYTQNTKKKYIYTALSGLALSIFMLFWSTGWHIGSLLLGVIGIRFLYLLIVDFAVVKKHPKKFFFSKPGELILRAIIFLISAGIFSQIIGWITGIKESFVNTLQQVLFGPLGATSIKNVASIDIWPNVLTTVAELNPGSWNQVLGSIGGGLFFFMAAIGAILAIFPLQKKENLRIHYLALLVLWFGGLTVAGIMASRFIALLAGPFAIALGAFFGMLWILLRRVKTKDVRISAQFILVIIAAILFISPIQTAHAIGKSEIPSMNDAWHTSLTEIGADTEDGIITSWWDFGHWFVNVAEERVTFDGGDQGRRIYWVGKLLMTDNAKESNDILRMLNCGQNKGYERLLEELDDNKYQASLLINKIIHEDEITARASLEAAGVNADYVLEKTHCSDEVLFDQYVIASQDMIGKANVWAHFGSWNFTKAHIYSNLRKLPYEEALTEMAALGITDEETAAQLYFEANNLKDSRAVDAWISPWPGYIIQNPAGCQNNKDNITCAIGASVQQQGNVHVVIDGLFVDTNDVQQSYLVLGTYQGTQRINQELIQPQKLTIWNNQSQEWETTTLENGAGFPYEFIVGPDATGNYKTIAGQDAVADSAFSKMFWYDGVGLDGYTKFSDRTSFNGQRIIVYKVDLARG